MKKGDILENLLIEDIADEGKGIAKIDGMVVFIPGVVPGDRVKAEVRKIKKNFLEGRLKAVLTPSPDRVEPFCQHFGICGGCRWQHLSYDAQLRFKQKQVEDSLIRIGGLSVPGIKSIIASRETTFYRNRLEYTFSEQRWLTWQEMNEEVTATPGLGFHIPKNFDKILDIQQCYLQPEPSNSIRLAVRDFALENEIPFFNLWKQTGYLRTMVIRTTNTGEVMIILQVTRTGEEWLDKIFNHLENLFPQITSFQFVINAKRNDTFNDLEVQTWKGNSFVTEEMKTPEGKILRFRLGPKSFYQTNAAQAQVLYEVAATMAGLKGNELMYDLYTGTGTIANFIASKAKKVIGIEYVSEAIEDAKGNSQLNEIINTEFFAGDIKDLLSEEFITLHGRPDVVITDPPRAGMHTDVCKMLLQVAPERIIYVSCNPATQARDLKILSEKYDVTDVQPVDMFPHTVHVENVVRMDVRK